MKKPFEHYLAFIEQELDIKLLCWQKMALHAIYDGHYPCISNIRNGKVIMCRAAQLLKEEMDRDTGILPPCLYELDGYTADATMCDEGWNESIE